MNMSDEEKKEYKKKRLIDELSKMPPMVIETAYLYAINYTLYGEDVTEKWVTATQNASALEKAYNKGYYDALKENQAERHKDCFQPKNDEKSNLSQQPLYEEVAKAFQLGIAFGLMDGLNAENKPPKPFEPITESEG